MTKQLRMTDPLHALATVRESRVVVDGDYDGLVWGTRCVVSLPGIGSVGEYTNPAHANRLAAAYRKPDATRADIFAAREANGEDVAYLRSRCGGAK